jgi:hypothetical protein
MKSGLRQNVIQTCLLAAALLAMPAAVQAQFTYTTNNGAITITGYTGSGGDVIIPNTINGLPVTDIGDWAFYFCPSLISVTIPDSITNIGDDAFWGCESLTSIIIPDSVTSIGYEAFAGCSSLTSVTIGNGVTSISDDMFIDSSLTTIMVSAQNPLYCSVNGVLFNKSQTTLILYPPGLGGNYTIPNGITNIGNNAFGYCCYLTSVTIPTSVTSIGNGAFCECFSLKNVTIPDSVIGIGSNAFYQCSSLRRIYFTGNAPLADSSVFSLDYTTAYYLTNASGWSSTFAGIPTAVWNPTPPPTLSISQLSPGVITLSWKGDMVLTYSGSLDFNYPWFRAGDTSPVTAPIGLGNSSIFAEESVGLDSQFFRLMDINDLWADFYANLYLARNSYAPTSIRLQACKACAAAYFLTAPFGDLRPNAYVEEALSIGYDLDPANLIVRNDLSLIRLINYRTYGP